MEGRFLVLVCPFTSSTRESDVTEEHRDKADREQLGTETPAAALPKIIPFASLTRCGEEVWIETGGQVYRLRKTRQGKLILTK
jgi:hemin uptake protein HemP